VAEPASPLFWAMLRVTVAELFWPALRPVFVFMICLLLTCG
jgi:hypothetical protein